MIFNELLKIHTDPISEKKSEFFELQEKLEHKKKQVEVFKRSGVPERFWNESFETYHPRDTSEQEILEKAKKYALSKNNDTVLLFTGNVGTGKTHLGSSIIRLKGGLYYYSDELVAQFVATSNYSSQITREDFVNKITSIDSLVIDEIGRSSYEIIEQNFLQLILCKRYDRKKGCCLISNMPKEELLTFLGKAVVDRLNQTCISCEFTGDSYRAVKRHITL